MRDSFDSYFLGWSLVSGTEDPAAETLTKATASFLSEDPGAAEEWRLFPFDGKADCYLHFVNRAWKAGALPGSVEPLVLRLKSEHPNVMK